ncbi:MAG: hypothetical protein WA830_20575 [Candidatus Sulfotelmatobacter sp.]
MKIIGITSTAILSLALAIAVPVAYGQQGEKQDHPEKQSTKNDQSKPEQLHAQQQKQPNQKQQQSQHTQQQMQSEQKQQQSQHAQQQQDKSNQQQHAQEQQQQKQQQHAQQQKQDHNNQQQHAQNGNTQPQPTQEPQSVQQSAWRQHSSQHWDSEHRNWQQRGGYHGYRIPDDRYRGYFGQDHGFRIYGLPFMVVGGYPRFQYHGYWLSAVDPWPQYWGNDWYDNDDVYVTYVNNGYYLYNRRYPNVGIAISISM